MQLSGRDQRLILRALELAQDELHNKIATCPNVFDFAEDIAELENEKRELRDLRDRIKTLGKDDTL